MKNLYKLLCLLLLGSPSAFGQITMNLGGPDLRVGVGFTTGQFPRYPLSFQNALGDKISLWNTNPASASAPHYGFGIQSSQFQLFAPTTGDNIVFGIGNSANFTENMRITGDGRVGINTSSPAGLLTMRPKTVPESSIGLDHANFDGSLRIGTYVAVGRDGGAFVRTHSNHPLHFATNSGDAQMTLSTNGLVGIGTTEPTLAGLVVDKKVGAVNAVFGSNTKGVSIESNFPGIGFNSYVNSVRKAIQPGFGGGIGQDPNTGRVYIHSSPVSTSTAGGNMPTVDRISILPNGNVGIGTTDPDQAGLVVNRKVFSTNAIFGSNTSGIAIESNFPTIVFNGYSVANLSRRPLVNGYMAGMGFNYATGEFGIFSSSGNGTTGSDLSSTTRLRIKANGNVGIGDVDPQAKLDVAGSVRLATGDQGEGKILTSDADGDASWQKAGYGAVELMDENLNGSVVGGPYNLQTDATYLLTVSENTDNDNRYSAGQYTVGQSGFYMVNGVGVRRFVGGGFY